MATIKDVARLANVSTTTVSNILNNKKNVSEAVYKKVLSVIDELNFNPNYLASNLKTNKTKLIAIIIPELDGFYCQIIKGIQSVLDEKGFYTIIRTTSNSSFKENELITEIVNMRINAILTVSSSNENLLKYEWAASKNIPLVFLERCFPMGEQNAVLFDNYSVIYEETKKIVKKSGGKSIALITCKEDFSDELECQKGFAFALRERGVQEEPLIIKTDVNCELAFKDIVKYLTELTKTPDYFIVTRESIAEVLYEALNVLGLSGQITCLSGNRWFDNKDKKRNMNYIPRDAIGLGSAGAKLLLEYIKSPLVFEKKKIVLEPQKQENVIVYADKGHSKKPLHVLMWKSPISDAVIMLYKDFCKETGIEIEYVQTNYSDLYSTIMDAKKRSKFDIFMIDFPWIQSFVEHQYLKDLSKTIKKDADSILDGYIDSVKGNFLDNGNMLYAIPFMATVQFLFYRNDLFKNPDMQWQFFNKYGIPLLPPKNWTEFEIIAEFFTKAYNPGSPVEYGTLIEGKESIGYMSEFLPRQWGFNGQIMNSNGEVVMDSVENKRALNNLCNSYKFSPKESVDNRWDYERDMFLRGDVAMLMTYATHLSPSSIEKYGIDYNNFKITRIPGNCPILGGWYFGIGDDSEVFDEAYTFIKWVTSSRVAIHNTLLGGLMPQKCITENSQLKFCFPWLKDMSKSIQAGRKREIVRDREGRIIDFHIIEEIMAEWIAKAVKNEDSIENCLFNMKASIENIIINHGKG